MHAYSQQTWTTPYVFPSYDGKKTFLVNKDSYAMNKENSFAFEVLIRTVLEQLEMIDKCSPLSIGNVKGANKVTLRNEWSKTENVVTVERILRDDGCFVRKWTWQKETFKVRNGSLKEAIERLLSCSPTSTKFASITLERDENWWCQTRWRSL